jgi:hypothetical protein
MMTFIKDLRAEEMNTSRCNVEARKLDDVSVAICVFDSPLYETFTVNLIFTREITHFHVAGTIGTGLEIAFAGCYTDRGTRVNNERDVLELDVV